jgi:hypothetical protein
MASIRAVSPGATAIASRGGRLGYHRGMARNRIGFEGERTLADAEQDEREAGQGSGTRCACGSERFVLEAYLEVEAGTLHSEPIEVEALTCPSCGREYEPIFAGGRVLRGEFRGFFEDGED